MDVFSNIKKNLNIKHNKRLSEDIYRNFTIRTLKRSQYFLGVGEDLEEVGFINKGLLRYFYVDCEGNEITKFFAKENDFVLSITGLIGRKSPFFIQALENSELLVIKTKKMVELIEKYDYWPVYLRQLQISYAELEERESDFLSLNASQRYEKFKNTHSAIIHRLQQQHIASYLGISPVSLSRIITNKVLNKC